MEKERIYLNEKLNFHPKEAFRRIDRMRNFNVASYDLALFMKDNYYNIYSTDLLDVIKSFDHNKDG